MGTFLLLIGFGVICSLACASIARSKGRSGFGWFLLGLVFSILAVILVACLPSKKVIIDPNAPTPLTHGHCPACQEFVLRTAIKCKHCGEALTPTPPTAEEIAAAQPPSEHKGWLIVGGCILFLVLVGRCTSP